MTSPAAAWMTADAIITARELWDAGLSCSEIARRVGTTKHSIIGLAHRRAWPPRPSPIGRTKDEVREAATERKPEKPHRKAGAPLPKPKASPKPKPAPVVLRVACKPERLAVPTASFSGCQWITGRKPWRFCDAPAERGAWCAKHHRIVYQHRSALVAA
jgi:hypothetical protein